MTLNKNNISARSKISIIMPIFNESENISLIIPKIKNVVQDYLDYEIIAIDDGSTDDSFNQLKDYSKNDKNLKVLSFSRNFGQTAALSAGISMASGDIIISIDSDLENDPEDIPKLIDKLNEGFDIVSGWRKKRWQESLISRRFPSVLANKLISFVTGVYLHDHGCTLKAYSRESIKDIPLYGEMHRFIAAYAAWHGYKVAEIPVNYTPRKFGKSNYGLGRIWKVVLDLLLFKFLTDYGRRPIHLFGSIGLISIVIGIVAGLLSVVFKISSVYHKDFVETPLPIIMATLIVVGVVFIMMGLLAEILIRTYFDNQNRKPYKIKETVNL